MARPALPADERRTYKLQLAFTELERAAIQAAADCAQVTFTEFVRAAGLAQARHNKSVQQTHFQRFSCSNRLSYRPCDLTGLEPATRSLEWKYLKSTARKSWSKKR